MGKDSKKKTLEEIYREAREKEGPVIIPPQIDGSYYNFLHENKSAGELGVLLKEECSLPQSMKIRVFGSIRRSH